MKPILRTALTTLAAALLVAALILVTAPPRGHAVTLLPAPTPAPIRIHISGAVKSPGLYDLPRGSRLSEAVEAAGGLTETADADAVNLAAVLNDGDKWTIPEKGAAPTYVEPDNPERSKPLNLPDQVINLNTATAADLETLPGIGPALAKDILAYRDAHGRFSTVEELLDVNGIGPAKFEGLQALVSVD